MDDAFPQLSRRRLLALGAAGTLATPWPAFAQHFPSRPLHIIVPFTSGGSTDMLSRAIAGELARSLGQQVLIDNVPGNGGTLGAARAARMPPDGHALLMGHVGTLAVNPSLYPNLDYDPLRSFVPIAPVARVPNVLVVKPSLPAKSLKELVSLAKQRPGKLTYGSAGNGSAAHATMELFKLDTGAPFLHIPYRGTAPSITDLLAGQVQVLFTGVPNLLPLIRSGKLRALAVSSPHRLAVLPSVPTVAESGLPGTKDFDADQWYGLVAPAGTPADVVELLNTHVNKALASPQVREHLAEQGAQPSPGTPQALGQLIAREIPRWQRVVKASRMTLD